MWLAAQPAVHWLSPRMRHAQANWQVSSSVPDFIRLLIFFVSDVCVYCSCSGLVHTAASSGACPPASWSGTLFCLSPCSARACARMFGLNTLLAGHGHHAERPGSSSSSRGSGGFRRLPPFVERGPHGLRPGHWRRGQQHQCVAQLCILLLWAALAAPVWMISGWCTTLVAGIANC